MADPPGGELLDIAGAAAHLGVSEVFVRRLVLERRVRYYKVGKFVRFRAGDLDAFVESGRRDPVEPWVHHQSPVRRVVTSAKAQRGSGTDRTSSASRQRQGAAER